MADATPNVSSLLEGIRDAIRTLEWAADKFAAEGMDGSAGVAENRAASLRELLSAEA